MTRPAPGPAPTRAAASEGDLVVGVDGARIGWVGVAWRGPGSAVGVHVAARLDDLVRACGPVAVVAVDMPVGLARMPGPVRWPCDVAVRPLLGPRRSSLFPAPLVDALDRESYAEANAWSKREAGLGLSKQAWMLAPRIREVRRFVADPDRPAVYETFPELAFRAMCGEPMAHPKRSWNGLAARLAALADHGLDLPLDAGPAGEVAADDIVDAAACAWSAVRIRDGRAERRPEPTDDPTGDPAPEETRGAGSPVPHDQRPTIWW